MNYKKIYQRIINNANYCTLSEHVYTERHHIKPKCMYGDNSENNLVKLTAREHYICHKLLSKIYPKNRGLLFAWYSFGHFKNETMKRDYIISSKEYEFLRKKRSEVFSEMMKGHEVSRKTRKKISESHRGKKLSENHKRKISLAKKGKSSPKKGIPLTEETKRKLSKSLKNRKAWNEGLTKESDDRVKNYSKPRTEETKRNISEGVKNQTILK